MIKTYSYKGDGNTKLSLNFRVGEFACPDGTDLILIDTRLIEFLQTVRDYFHLPVLIRSGFRSAKYNKKIGGAPQSHHLYGRAADIDVGIPEIDVRRVAMKLELLGAVRIGMYKYSDGTSWVHVSSYNISRSMYESLEAGILKPIDSFIPILKRVKKFTYNDTVRVLQEMLTEAGMYSGEIDGKFGELTDKAVRNFQRITGLIVDGIVGIKTWNRLFL